MAVSVSRRDGKEEMGFLFGVATAKVKPNKAYQKLSRSLFKCTHTYTRPKRTERNGTEQYRTKLSRTERERGRGEEIRVAVNPLKPAP